MDEMPTKRTPKTRRNLRPRITRELVDLFIRHERLSKIYEPCTLDERCKYPDPDRVGFCAKCVEFIEAANELHRLLRAPVWQCSGVDADGPDPPDYMHEQMAEGWRRSWEVRQELEAAAAEIKRNGRFAK
jgi:hypothetical protein